ncbi:MAG TPA: radical SAM protein [Anaerolineales bacterium]|nr:radical SAM protein [Anaerolineales bacterium]
MPEKRQYIYDWNTIVLQPTSICNLNCSYCYLPDRQEKRFMKIDVVKRVAKTIGESKKQIMVLWHNGEPLTTGIERFSQYLQVFNDLCEEGSYRHSIQTNATLIDDEWCVFLKKHNFRVGVSLDGNATHNLSRKNWAGQDSFESILRGIKLLKKYEIPFGIITVINKHNIDSPENLYNFLTDLHPQSISINFEENEGLNNGRVKFSKLEIDNFWRRLFAEWRKNPTTSIRHFKDALAIMNSLIDNTYTPNRVNRNLYPTVDTDGNVVLLSPEFLSVNKNERNKFIVGNVLKEDLASIVNSGINVWYVKEFVEGTELCAKSCNYFAFCHGGQASNKYFENGTTRSTETMYCYSARISPAKTILEHVN